jgi:hypothetical protein
MPLSLNSRNPTFEVEIRLHGSGSSTLERSLAQDPGSLFINTGGLSFTSAADSFLSTPVPQPTTLGLVLTGIGPLLLASLAGRTRRQNSCIRGEGGAARTKTTIGDGAEGPRTEVPSTGGSTLALVTSSSGEVVMLLLAQSQAHFRDEAARRRYLAECRWSDGSHKDTLLHSGGAL